MPLGNRPLWFEVAENSQHTHQAQMAQPLLKGKGIQALDNVFNPPGQQIEFIVNMGSTILFKNESEYRIWGSHYSFGLIVFLP